MEDSESKRFECPHGHDSEKEQHHDKQNGEAVAGVDRLCPLISDVQRHEGKLKGFAQLQVVQYRANVLSAEIITRQVLSNLEGLARVDVEGRVAEGFGGCRVLEVTHGSVERELAEWRMKRELCLMD